MDKKRLTIAIDFDGTVVTHKFPHIGKDVGAVPVLKKLVNAGHRLILYTMRSDGEYSIKRTGIYVLKEAVQWFKDNGIELWGVNNNPNQWWSNSPKVHADFCIDDRNVGCPLKYDEEDGYYVDWEKIEYYFKAIGAI